MRTTSKAKPERMTREKERERLNVVVDKPTNFIALHVHGMTDSDVGAVVDSEPYDVASEWERSYRLHHSLLVAQRVTTLVAHSRNAPHATKPGLDVRSEL